MNKELNFAVCDDDEIVCEAICTKIISTMFSFFRSAFASSTPSILGISMSKNNAS